MKHIIKKLLIILLMPTFLASTDKQPFTLMLNPFGDAGHAGRIIDGSYERGLTLQFAEKLKSVLKERCPHVRVILTRFPGERLEQHQNANFANRLKTDLYLNIQFYHQEHDLAHLTLFYFIQHPTELWAKQAQERLACIPYNQAHRAFLSDTRMCAQHINKALQKIGSSNSFIMHGVYPCPFKPLVGIHTAALGIEIGLKHKDDWQRFVQPLALSLERLVPEGQ